jgi:hypothetical protein
MGDGLRPSFRIPSLPAHGGVRSPGKSPAQAAREGDAVAKSDKGFLVLLDGMSPEETTKAKTSVRFRTNHQNAAMYSG